MSVKGELRYKNVDDGGSDFGGGLAVNIPIKEDVAGLRIVGNRVVEPGYIDNDVDGTENTNDYEAHNIRAVFYVEPNDRLKIRLTGTYNDADQGAFGTLNGDPEDQTLFSISTDGSFVKDKYYIASANLSYKFDKISVESITSYFERNRDRRQLDPFFTNQTQAIRQLFALTNPLVPFGGPDLSGLLVASGPVEPVFSVDTSHFDQISQELRFVSDFDGPFNFVAGAFFRSFDQSVVSTTDSVQSVALLPVTLFNIAGDQLLNPASVYAGYVPTFPANPSTLGSELGDQLGLSDFFGAPGTAATNGSGKQYSAFFELTYDLTDRLSVTAGLRSHNEELNASSIAASYDLLAGLLGANVPRNFPPADAPSLGDVDVNVFLPKFAVEYKASEELLVYGLYSEGVRNGNINSGSTGPAILQTFGEDVAREVSTFEEERVRSFELGLKYQSLDGRIGANIAGFYNLFEDIQSFIVFAGPPSAGIIDNVGDGDTIGVEAEVFYQPNDYLRLFAGGSYTKAEIDTINVSDGFVVGTVPGQPIPFIPDFSLNVGADFNRPVGNDGLVLVGRAFYSYTGSYSTFADGAPGSAFNPTLGKFGIANASVGLRNDNWSLDLRVSNLFNKREINQVSPTTAVIQGSLGGLNFAPADAPANFADDFQITRPRTISVVLGFEF